MASTACALVIGIGELIAAFSVGMSGALANTFGLRIVMAVSASAAFLGLIVSLFIIEPKSQKTQTSSPDQSVEI